MPAYRDSALHRRLALLSGGQPEAMKEALRTYATEATESPAFDLMALLCRTLSDRNRLVIASMLKRHGPLTGAEIEAALAVSQPTVSHHMRALQDAGIVEAERTGRWTYYRLDARFERLVP